MSNPTPEQFAGFDQLEGFSPIDKAELVGKPFGITGVRLRESERQIAYAEVEIVTIDGEDLGFQDASTGVRDQLAAYMHANGLTLGSEWTDIRLYVPNGLRTSTYEVKIDGHTREAKTYYLTTAGRTRGPAPERRATSVDGEAKRAAKSA